MSYFFEVTVEYRSIIYDREKRRTVLAQIVAGVLSSCGTLTDSDSVEVVFAVNPCVNTGEMTVTIETRHDPLSEGSEGQSTAEQGQAERIGQAIREANILSGIYLKPGGFTVIFRVIREATSSF
jgi:hypothetical protein